MLTHPANLLLRFVLEIAALIGIGQWAWQKYDGLPRYLIGIGLPLLLYLAWGVFKTPGEPGAGPKKVLVPISGRARLLFEITWFLFALWCMFIGGNLVLGGILIFTLLLQYFWSAERVVWLWNH